MNERRNLWITHSDGVSSQVREIARRPIAGTASGNRVAVKPLGAERSESPRWPYSMRSLLAAVWILTPGASTFPDTIEPTGGHMALTPKQEKFVRALVGGASQREAYRHAYDCENSSDATVDRKAYDVFRNGQVRARYNELIAEVSDRVMWDRARAARELMEVRDIALRHIAQTVDLGVNITATNSRELADLPKTATQLLIASTAELNKMFRVYDQDEATDDTVRIVDDIT